MSSTLIVKKLEFVRSAWDTLSTGRVQLDSPGPTFRITMHWLPQSESWTLDLFSTAGATIVTGTWIRDRCDCLLGVSTAGRPPGAIMSYNPNFRVDPDLNAFTTGGAMLYYVPAGLNPNDFSAYPIQVV